MSHRSWFAGSTGPGTRLEFGIVPLGAFVPMTVAEYLKSAAIRSDGPRVIL